jgi:ribonucleotide reductase beta subunit family protein with ferritin-like domain
MSEYIQSVLGDDRLITLPISRPDVWEFYKLAQRSFWIPEEVNVSSDIKDYNEKLTEGERLLVKHILAFFAATDKIVNINIIERFKKDFDIYEISSFYSFQETMENIHGEMYAILLHAIITDPAERDSVLNAVKTMPIIAKITDYVYECINSNASVGERLLRMVCVEGILFIGAFCAIYWLQERGLMKGLSQSNELIGRDESLHTMFGLLLYSLLKPEYKLKREKVYEIFRGALDIASEFISAALPKDLPEMNSALMTQYLERCADNLIVTIGFPHLYNSKNPFGFMEKINGLNKTNFFERRVSEYSKVSEAERDNDDVAEDY